MRKAPETSREEGNQENTMIGNLKKIIQNRIGAILFGGITIGSAIAGGYQGREVIKESVISLKEGTGLNHRLFSNEPDRAFFYQWCELESGFQVAYSSKNEVSVDTIKKQLVLPQTLTIGNLPDVLTIIRKTLGLPHISYDRKNPEEIEKQFLSTFLEYGKLQIVEKASTFSQQDLDNLITEYRESHTWMGSGLEDSISRQKEKYVSLRSELPKESIKISTAIDAEGIKKGLDEARKQGDVKKIVKIEKEAITKIYDILVQYPWTSDENVADSTLFKNIEKKHLNCNGKSAFMLAFLETLGISCKFVEVANPNSTGTHQAVFVITSNGTNWYVDPTYGNTKNLSRISPKRVGSYWQYPGLNDEVGEKGDEYLCVFESEQGLMNAQLQNFANYYYSHGYYSQAMKMYSKGLKLAGGNNHFGLAQSLQRLGKKRDALKQYHLANEHFPENVELKKYIKEIE